ncbi:myocyte-specific enhancer factor 2 [Anaeramoeba flamelloides]|uniref:Myocyte-specific enhancer factor 2 n=1 Tax=Anaeramoeba flamelloides TaxID=1746091 RepID=A0ABQ8Z0N8_9EUKA|nr:myocyte-specific enhancer factor 2 [Anaeramoeba flamelloides]
MYFIQVPKRKKIESKNFKKVLEIILFIGLLAIFFFWFVYALLTRPERVVIVSQEYIVEMDEQLSDYDCKCKTKDITYETFMEAEKGETCSNRYPVDWPSGSNVTEYSMCQAIRESISHQLDHRVLISDYVISKSSLEARRLPYVRSVAMNSYLTWMGVAIEIGFYVKQGIDEGLINGNISKLENPTLQTETKYDMYNTWQDISRQFEKTMTVNHTKYIESCDPYECKSTEKVPITSTIFSGLGIFGGMFALFTWVGGIIFNYYERRTIEKRYSEFDHDLDRNIENHHSSSNGRSDSGQSSGYNSGKNKKSKNLNTSLSKNHQNDNKIENSNSNSDEIEFENSQNQNQQNNSQSHSSELKINSSENEIKTDKENEHNNSSENISFDESDN